MKVKSCAARQPVQNYHPATVVRFKLSDLCMTIYCLPVQYGWVVMGKLLLQKLDGRLIVSKDNHFVLGWINGFNQLLSPEKKLILHRYLRVEDCWTADQLESHVSHL